MDKKLINVNCHSELLPSSDWWDAKVVWNFRISSIFPVDAKFAQNVNNRLWNANSVKKKYNEVVDILSWVSQ